MIGCVRAFLILACMRGCTQLGIAIYYCMEGSRFHGRGGRHDGRCVAECLLLVCLCCGMTLLCTHVAFLLHYGMQLMRINGIN